jgi:hypothetical protein
LFLQKRVTAGFPLPDASLFRGRAGPNRLPCRLGFLVCLSSKCCYCIWNYSGCFKLSPSPAPNTRGDNCFPSRRLKIVFRFFVYLHRAANHARRNVTGKVSLAHFFSVLEDGNGNFWFASIGSGVYYFGGKYFQNFTTKDGLASDRVTNIYEEKPVSSGLGLKTV